MLCEANDYSSVDHPGDADLIIINSCGAMQRFEEETLRLVQQVFADIPRDTQVVVAGCLNIIHPEYDKALSQPVSKVILPEDLGTLIPCRNYPGYCTTLDQLQLMYYIRHSNEQSATKKTVTKTVELLETWAEFCGYPRLHHAKLDRIMDLLQKRRKTVVKIGSGCNFNCSYCAVKKVKGEPVSRKISEILEDIRQCKNPVTNLELFMEDCGSYGIDGDGSFPELVSRIVDEFPDIRLDISNLHPYWLLRQPEDYLHLFRNHRINSVLLPVQSGSNAVLERMNRHYRIEEVLEMINKIRHDAPDVFIWTHVITGFPGETRRDFWNTIKITPYFDFYYAFSFSPRQGTVAWEHNGQLSEWIRTGRTRILHGIELFSLLKKCIIH